MKILLDCVVTSADPAKCSSNVQFLTFVKRTLVSRTDVFFYWLIPDWITEEQFLKVYPQHPNVRYLRGPQHKDRTKEYLTVTSALDHAVAFNGDYWDYDVLVTMRSGLVPLFRLLMNSPRTPNLSWLKEVWLIEEMPLMDFKPTVCTFNPDVQDLYTLAGYLAADKTYILSYHEPIEIVRRAKDFLTPSNVRKIEAKLKSVVTSQDYSFTLKTPEQWYAAGAGKPFVIGHSGRMEKANRIDEINSVMTKQFVKKGDAVRLVVTTVSSVVKTFDEDVIEVTHASREEFWKLCHEMHVFLKLSKEGGFALSLLEPMMLGVPAIIAREKWSEGVFGPGYPFFVQNEAQAYALVQMFYEDYAAMHAKWAKWFVEEFKPMMEVRFKNDLLYSHLDRDIDQFKVSRAKFVKTHPGKRDNELVKDVLATVGDAKEFVLVDAVAKLVAAHKMDKKILDKLTPGDRDTRGLVWSSSLNDYRVILQEFHGWEDASTKVGHMRRKGV